MEAPIQALRNIGVPFRHNFSSDICPKVRKTISCNNEPEILYTDMLTRDIGECPRTDVYITGFPCQPFSAAGKQQGFEDTKGRGKIFFSVLEYIKVKNPKIFILENVKGLVTLEKGMYCKTIMRMLRSVVAHKDSNIAFKGPLYEVEYRIMNTKDQGIAQSRARWYCVGLRRDLISEKTKGDGAPALKWPESLPCPHLS